MPLKEDVVVHGPGPMGPARAMMLTLSEGIFADIRTAVLAQRAGASALSGNLPPPPAVEVSFTKPGSSSEKSPGQLFIGGQSLQLTSVPERIFDIYAQPHESTDVAHGYPLTMRAIVSQTLKVPLSLSNNLVERTRERTAVEESERQKRGLVRIADPVPQGNAKKRKVGSGSTAPARPDPVTKRAPARPQPQAKTAPPPLMTASALAQAARSTTSDSSSSSSQPLSQLPATSRLSGTNNHTAQPSPLSTPPLGSKPSPRISASKPSIPPPISSATAVELVPDAERTPEEGWKTSSFRGGVRTKTTSKAGGKAAGGGGPKGKVKSNPIITDDVDPPIASSSRPLAPSRDSPAPPVPKPSRSSVGGLKAGTKRSRDVEDANGLDVVDADLLAAADVTTSSSATRRQSHVVDDELVAAAAVPTRKKPTGATATKRSVGIVDDELDAAAAYMAPARASSGTKGKGKTTKFDDEDFDVREERRQLKKASARASTSSTTAAAAPTPIPAKGAVSRKSIKGATPVRAPSPPEPSPRTTKEPNQSRANGNSAGVAVNGTSKKNGQHVSSSTNGTTTNGHGGVKITVSRATNGSTAAQNGSSAKRSGSSTVKPSRRPSPTYTDSEDEAPKASTVVKTKNNHLKPPSTSTSIPPSPVSTVNGSRAPRPSSSSLTPNQNPTPATTPHTDASPIRKKRRISPPEDDSRALIKQPLPTSPDALREHYNTIYVVYINLWARICAERHRYGQMLKRNPNASDDGETSSAESAGENVETLMSRYGKLHERLQTIRSTLGF